MNDDIKKLLRNLTDEAKKEVEKSDKEKENIFLEQLEILDNINQFGAALKWVLDANANIQKMIAIEEVKEIFTERDIVFDVFIGPAMLLGLFMPSNMLATDPGKGGANLVDINTMSDEEYVAHAGQSDEIEGYSIIPPNIHELAVFTKYSENGGSARHAFEATNKLLTDYTAGKIDGTIVAEYMYMNIHQLLCMLYHDSCTLGKYRPFLVNVASSIRIAGNNNGGVLKIGGFSILLDYIHTINQDLPEEQQIQPERPFSNALIRYQVGRLIHGAGTYLEVLDAISLWLQNLIKYTDKHIGIVKRLMELQTKNYTPPQFWFKQNGKKK